MLVAGDASFKGNIDSALLRYWGDWQRRKKVYAKHLERMISGRNSGDEGRQKFMHELAITRAEINTLRICINQVHACRHMKSILLK